MISGKNTVNAILVLLSSALTACGGGTTAPTASQGKFIDSAVEGLSYVSGNQSGITNADGLFTYDIGKPVTFSIGGIELGTTLGAPTVTPVQLVSGAEDEKNNEVTNIVRFLLTLDDDQKSTTGIKITKEIRDLAVNETINFSTLSSVTTVLGVLTGNPSLKDTPEAAQAHLKKSLQSLLAGIYTGTFSGEDAGNWNVTISENSVITGGARSSSGSLTRSILGSVSTDGGISASGTGSGSDISWFGRIDITTGIFSGTWTDSSNNLSGAFSGKKIAPLQV